MAVVHILKQKGGDVITVKPSDTVQTIVDLLARHRIGAVVVVDNIGGIAGIVSERDVVRAMAGNASAVVAKTAGESLHVVLYGVALVAAALLLLQHRPLGGGARD